MATTSPCMVKSLYGEWHNRPARRRFNCGQRALSKPGVWFESPAFESGTPRSCPEQHGNLTALSLTAPAAVEDESELNSLDRTFTALASQWREATETISSIDDMVLHPAYQRIIGMGPAVLPLILRELQRRPDHWFWALRAITGVDPIREEQRGNVREMAADWLGWAKTKGLDR